VGGCSSKMDACLADREMPMDKIKRSVSQSFLAIGIVFLIIGFVQQGFTLDSTSGLFSLGVIFVLSGLVAHLLEKKS